MILRCISCGKKFEPVVDRYTCDVCGSIAGTLIVEYDFDTINVNRREFTKYAPMYQFEKLLPVSNYSKVASAVGGTPLLFFENTFGLDRVAIKNDGMNLSASLKDRASLIAVNMAIENNKETIFCASTGNAASSLSLIAASTELKTVIFVPKTIPKGKLAQLNASGAEIILFDGNYDQTFDHSLSVGFSKGWYSRNSAINPYLLEGKKTVAYEILIQSDYEVPDYCFVAVGDGTVISAVIKGFVEFKKLGLTDRIPQVIGVQASGAQTLKHVYEEGPPFSPIREEPQTIADSISVGYPRDVVKACHFLNDNGGKIIDVSDEMIVRAVYELTQKTGVFPEPAGAAPLAGLNKMMTQNEIKKEDKVVLIVTGNGLKDTSVIGG